jgi:hypothetical protein
VKTQHLRKDKTCLNCGTEVPDRFCSHCGQENVETKESFGHLLNHFFQDITHYDSKFLSTLKYLFFYPGYLTKRYLVGHRADFVNPIRLYVFTSFVFFLVLSMVGGSGGDLNIKLGDSTAMAKISEEFEKGKAKLQDSLARAQTAEDSAELQKVIRNLEFGGGSLLGVEYHTPREYDSLQQLLPPAERDGFLQRKFTEKSLDLRARYGDRAAEVIKEKFLHNYPKLMFILLPFFALVLKWFFAGNKMYYAEHGIFSIHIHTFIFLLAIPLMLINLLLQYDDLYTWMMWVVFIYYIFALRNVYRKTFMGALGRGVLSLVVYFAGTVLVLLLFLLFILIFV